MHIISFNDWAFSMEFIYSKHYAAMMDEPQVHDGFKRKQRIYFWLTKFSYVLLMYVIS